MTFFWICVVLMAFVCIAILLSNNDTIDEAQFEKVSKSAIDLLHVAERFSKDRYWKNNIGHISLMVLYDADWSKNLGYTVHSFVISVHLLKDNIALIKEQTENKEIADWFDLKLRGSSWYYEQETMFIKGSDKKISKKIYNKIIEEFPNAKCELSGSGVIYIDFV